MGNSLPLVESGYNFGMAATRQLSVLLRKQVREKSNGRCACCGSGRGLHVHHIVAFADGGPTDFDNLALLCANCHREWHTLSDIAGAPHDDVMCRFDAFCHKPPIWLLGMMLRSAVGTDVSGKLSADEIHDMALAVMASFKEPDW